MPQTGWCEAIEMYAFTVLEAGSSKSRSQQDRAPSEAPGRSLPGPLQLLAVAVVPVDTVPVGAPRLSVVTCHPPVHLGLHKAFPSSCWGTSHIGFERSPMPSS